MDLIETVGGIFVAVLVGIPLLSLALTIIVGFLIGAAMFLGYMALYVVGIPLAIYFRLRFGYWPHD
jgi:hypothetical protein